MIAAAKLRPLKNMRECGFNPKLTWEVYSKESWRISSWIDGNSHPSCPCNSLVWFNKPNSQVTKLVRNPEDKNWKHSLVSGRCQSVPIRHDLLKQVKHLRVMKNSSSRMLQAHHASYNTGAFRPSSPKLLPPRMTNAMVRLTRKASARAWFHHRSQLTTAHDKKTRLFPCCVS